MKNITLSAPERLIELAREKAAKQKTSLNKRFREWLKSYVNKPDGKEEYDRLMKKFDYVNAGGKYTREQMNER